MENDGKLRLLYIAKLLYENTGEEYSMSTTEIIDRLQSDYGISAHRTTISADIEALRTYGLDVCKIESTQNRYFIGSRLFEMPELRLLIDSVIAAGFLTEKKSKALVEKLTVFTDKTTARHLFAGMSFEADSKGNSKTDNEKIYYIIDALCRAIVKKKRISFLYYGYDENKSPRLKNNGEPYVISPYALTKNGECYYIVGFSEKHGSIGSFRVERIATVPELLCESIRPIPEDFDLGEYRKTVFRMFAGEEQRVRLLCDSSVMNAVIDHFGSDIPIFHKDPESFEIEVGVAVSPVFFRWVFGFEGRISIVAPEDIRTRYRDMVLREAERLR